MIRQKKTKKAKEKLKFKISLADIKINEHKPEKSQQEEEKLAVASDNRKRAGYTSIAIQKFLNPYKFYRFRTDLVICEENQKFIIRPEFFNHFKIIPSAVVDGDVGVLIIHLEESQNSGGPPSDYAIKRWESFGQSEAHEWAVIVKEQCDVYKSNYEKIYKEINQLPKGILEVYEAEITQLLKTVPCAAGRMTLTPEHCYMTSVYVNNSFLNTVGLEFETLIKYCLTKGYPNWFYEENHQFEKTHYQFYMKSLFQSEIKKKVSKETHSCLIDFKTKEGVPVRKVSYVFPGIDENSNVYFDCLTTYEVDLTRPRIKIKDTSDLPLIDDMNMKRREITDPKNLFPFLNNYYGANYPNDPTKFVSNVCRIKHLFPNKEQQTKGEVNAPTVKDTTNAPSQMSVKYEELS